VTACSKPRADAQKPQTEASPAAATATSGAANSLRVVGRSPAASGGFPSIVILEPQAPANTASQDYVPYMDQVQQTFIPSILLVRTGQPTEFRNNDDVLHNVRVREDATHASAFNVAIPTGEKYLFTFQRDGFYDVGCDIHPGMSAQIVSSSSPYMTLADAEGGFVLENVPAGAYKAIVYAGAQKIEKAITLAQGQTEIDIRN
jgi:plastocyanin